MFGAKISLYHHFYGSMAFESWILFSFRLSSILGRDVVDEEFIVYHFRIF